MRNVIIWLILFSSNISQQINWLKLNHLVHLSDIYAKWIKYFSNQSGITHIQNALNQLNFLVTQESVITETLNITDVFW